MENSNENIKDFNKNATELAIKHAKIVFGDDFNLEDKDVNKFIKAFLLGFNIAIKSYLGLQLSPLMDRQQ